MLLFHHEQADARHEAVCLHDHVAFVPAARVELRCCGPAWLSTALSPYPPAPGGPAVTSAKGGWGTPGPTTHLLLFSPFPPKAWPRPCAPLPVDEITMTFDLGISIDSMT